MYIFIFCQTGDIVARLLYDNLLEKNQSNVKLVTETELAMASWLHQAASDGNFSTHIRLRDGFIIEGSIISKVVNRINYFPMPHFIKATNRQYAEMEMFALYTSFLFAVKEKVIDGMQVRNIISNNDNSMYYYSLAIKAGIDVLDNQFSSAPKWLQPKGLTALTTLKKQTALWHRKSPHLVWENKPVLYNEKFTSLLHAEVIAGKVFCKTGSAMPKFSEVFQKKIKKFSLLCQKSVYTLTLTLIKGKYKLVSCNITPAVLSTDAIDAYSSFLIKNKN